MRRILLAVIILLYCGVSYAAEAQPASLEIILAKVGDKVLTKSDFDAMVTYYSAERKTDLSRDEKFKQDLLDILVKRMAFASAARKKGIDKQPEVVQLIEFYKNGILASRLIEEEVTSKLAINETDLSLYYTMNESEFRHPDMIRVRHILLKVTQYMNDEDRAKVREKAEAVHKRIMDGEDFATLASEVSEDNSSRHRGGDLGLIQKGKVAKPFENAAFSLKPGEVSGVVETSSGYHIIKLDEKVAAGVWPFDTVKESIQEKVRQKFKESKTKELTERVLKEAGVEVHPELLNSGKKEEAQPQR